jgi:hypothetical protein
MMHTFVCSTSIGGTVENMYQVLYSSTGHVDQRKFNDIMNLIPLDKAELITEHLIAADKASSFRITVHRGCINHAR